MFCPNCGKDCGEAKFCSNCGQSVQEDKGGTANSVAYPPLNEPYTVNINGKNVDLNRVVRTYGTGIRKTGAYTYLTSEFGISAAQAKQFLDPIYEAHAGEKISFWSSLAANVNLINDGKNQEAAERRERERKLEDSGLAYCPKCKSTSISAQKRGYSVGQAILGGTLAGAIGSNRVYCVCLKCGHKWTP